MLILREATKQDLSRLLDLEQCVVEAERPFNSAIKSESAFYYDIEDLITNSMNVRKVCLCRN